MALKILLVDSNPNRASSLDENLTAAGFAEICRVPVDCDLAEAVARLSPDLLIINMSLPDRDALEDIRLLSAARPIVMFGADEDPAFVEEAIAAGVCSYNLSGVSARDVKPIVMSAIALFNRYKRVEAELEATRALLDERRFIERAKAILMRNRKLTEPEAYAWLRRKAMNENRKIALVAAELVGNDDGRS